MFIHPCCELFPSLAVTPTISQKTVIIAWLPPTLATSPPCLRAQYLNGVMDARRVITLQLTASHFYRSTSESCFNETLYSGNKTPVCTLSYALFDCSVSDESSNPSMILVVTCRLFDPFPNNPNIIIGHFVITGSCQISNSQCQMTKLPNLVS